MKKTLKRAVVGASVAGLLGTGALVEAAPAQAGPPGDLQIIGGVNCVFKVWGQRWNSGPVWQTDRFIGVRNAGGSTMTNVSVTEFGGATKRVAANKTLKTRAGELKAGQTSITHRYTHQGCWPESISGYTIGAEVENPVNNVGYWENQIAKSIPRGRGGNSGNAGN
ncbi:MAG: hypothetical protein QM809_02070 [Gordonia sp. (in: high G+C Gram-positive bacteria)]|uniref:hypothetical protein n=1 Tax=Gordonia sp. (in: high G+C Gram-positive bacteria) TaxID=84139 RepID=UPI0039E39522